MKKITCKICETSFNLVEENHYIARNGTITGLATLSSNTEPTWHDATDCPVCGCQIILQPRLRKVEVDE